MCYANLVNMITFHHHVSIKRRHASRFSLSLSLSLFPTTNIEVTRHSDPHDCRVASRTTWLSQEAHMTVTWAPQRPGRLPIGFPAKSNYRAQISFMTCVWSDPLSMQYLPSVQYRPLMSASGQRFSWRVLHSLHLFSARNCYTVLAYSPTQNKFFRKSALPAP